MKQLLAAVLLFTALTAGCTNPAEMLSPPTPSVDESGTAAPTPAEDPYGLPEIDGFRKEILPSGEVTVVCYWCEDESVLLVQPVAFSQEALAAFVAGDADTFMSGFSEEMGEMVPGASVKGNFRRIADQNVFVADTFMPASEEYGIPQDLSMVMYWVLTPSADTYQIAASSMGADLAPAVETIIRAM